MALRALCDRRRAVRVWPVCARVARACGRMGLPDVWPAPDGRDARPASRAAHVLGLLSRDDRTVARRWRGAGGHPESVAPVDTRLGRMAALTQRLQPPPLTAVGARVALGCRAEPRAVARHGLTRGGRALKWPPAIDRYREGSEADAASARHQAKPHRLITGRIWL